MRPAEIVVRGCGLLVVAFLTSPVILVVLFAFTSNTISNFPIHGLSLRWWREMLAFEPLGSAVANSLSIGLAVGVASAVVGTMAALGLAECRHGGPPRSSLPWRCLCCCRRCWSR